MKSYYSINLMRFILKIFIYTLILISIKYMCMHVINKKEF